MKNLASYAGEKVINFECEPLKSADLFSIVGPTGSGKSTILDALCLALYGKTPRYTGAEKRDTYLDKGNKEELLKPNDNRNIMRKGTKECFSEVTFVSGNARYRAFWSCRIARTAMSREEQRLYRCDFKDGAYGDEYEVEFKGSPVKRNTEILGHIEGIIGLNYEQFTRTVMLAQNSFAGFLTSKDNEKALILEKLTSTGIFSDIACKIIDFAAAAKADFDAVKEKYDNLGQNLMQPEEKAQAEAALNDLKAKLGGLIEDKEKMNASLAWIDALERLLKQRAEDVVKQQKAQTDCDGNADLRKSMSLYNCVMRIKDQFDSWRKLVGDIQALTREAGNIDIKMQQSQTELDNCNQILATYGQRLKVCEDAQTSQQPAINKARTEKVHLDNKKANADNAAQELKAAQTTLTAEQAVLDKDRADRSVQERIIAQQTAITMSFANDERMLSQIDTVIMMLKDLNDIQRTFHRETASVDDEMGKIRADETALLNDEDKISRASSEIEALNRRLEQEKASIGGKDLNDIQQRLNAQNRLVTDYDRISKLTQDIICCDHDIQEYNGKIAAASKAAAALEVEKKSVDDTIGIISRQLEELRAATAESAEAMRASLEEGKPCPVCGATHHPYKDDTLNPFRKLIRDKEVEIKDQQAESTRLDTSIRTSSANIARWQGIVESFKNQLRQSRSELHVYQADYAVFIVSAAQRQQALLECAKEQKAAIQREFDDYTMHSSNVSKMQTKLNATVSVYNKIKVNYDKKTGELSNRKTAVATRRSALKTDGENIETKKGQIDAVITVTDWQSLWNADPQRVIAMITQKDKIYREAKARIDNASKESDRLSALIGEKESYVASLTAACNAKKDACAAAVQEYETRLASYQLILDGADPDDYERRLKQAVDDAKVKVDEQSKKCQRIAQDISTLRGEKSAKADAIAKSTSARDAAKNDIDTWLNQFNRDDSHQHVDIDLLSDYFSDRYEWNEIKLEIDQIDSALGSANSAVGAVEKSIRNHQESKDATDKTKEEIRAALAALASEQKDLENQKTDVSARLQVHRSNEAGMHSLINELTAKKALYDDWNTLRKGISGNGEGDKARNAVQCFSLKYLVFQANAQLAYLNRRYSLEAIDGTLDINVIDHDQADAVRNVSSLSGGETFLVSLSLALALSEISANNINIENLFIDEGFGTLDTDSLQIVIDALSNLHSMQGKRVGVISHTTEIRERIHTQICVKKMVSNGASDIEIL